MMFCRRFLFACLPWIALAMLAPASVLAGDITIRDLRSSPPVEIVLDGDDIAALPDATIVTRTDFTDGETRFEGPLATAVFALAGVEGWDVARMIAANDYAVDIPAKDFTVYGVILAHSADGARLSRRDKGPYWVMYPLDDFDELSDPVYNNRLIWQLVAVELR